MCIITDENHIVKSVSLIPGLVKIPDTWHLYFPANCKINKSPNEGDYYKE